jgi:hypothetical protein
MIEAQRRAEARFPPCRIRAKGPPRGREGAHQSRMVTNNKSKKRSRALSLQDPSDWLSGVVEERATEREMSNVEIEISAGKTRLQLRDRETSCLAVHLHGRLGLGSGQRASQG